MKLCREESQNILHSEHRNVLFHMHKYLELVKKQITNLFQGKCI